MSAEADAAVHARLTQTVPGYSARNPLAHWNGADDPRLELKPGYVLRAREGDPSDPYFVIRVVGPHYTHHDAPPEYAVQPYFEFGETIAAPLRGEGGLLAAYEVLTESQVASLIAERAAAAEPVATNVDAAREQVAAAREETGR
jgi:hypothetical protein